jgi:hypothetical protein
MFRCHIPSSAVIMGHHNPWAHDIRRDFLMTKPFPRIVLAAALSLSACLAGQALAQEAKPDMKAEAAKPAKGMSAAQAALRERQKACGAEWKTVKASGKAEAGMKWPKFWSACNTRMKGEKKA